jgi:hypothetical protein
MVNLILTVIGVEVKDSTSFFLKFSMLIEVLL